MNLIGSHALFGRNWGCLPGTEFKYLHFELCYYQVTCYCWSFIAAFLVPDVARRIPHRDLI